MLAQTNSRYTILVRLAIYGFAAITAVAILWAAADRQSVEAQDRNADESSEVAPAAASGPAQKSKSINIFALAVAGGIFMIPIAGMSILAVTMTIERLLALRKQRVLPDGLVDGLGEQTRRSLAIIRAAIEALGGRIEQVIRTRMYVTDVSKWEEVARVHGERSVGGRRSSATAPAPRRSARATACPRRGSFRDRALGPADHQTLREGSRCSR